MALPNVYSRIESCLTTVKFEFLAKPEREFYEFIPPVAMLLQGVAWGNPQSTFPLSRNYVAMEQIAPESVWSLIWISIGIVSSFCVVSKNLLARRIAALLVGILFFLVAVSFLCSNPQNTYSIVILAISAQSLTTYIKLGADYE